MIAPSARHLQMVASRVAVQRMADGALYCMAHAPSDWEEQANEGTMAEVQPWDLDEDGSLTCEEGHEI